MKDKYVEKYTYTDGINENFHQVEKLIVGDDDAESINTMELVHKDGIEKINKIKIDNLWVEEKIEYDFMENVISVTDRNAFKTEYSYTADNGKIIVETINPDNTNYFDYYDMLGRKVESIDPKGNMFNYKYDGLGRLRAEELPFAGQYKTIKTYSYDNNDNIIQTTVTNGAKGTSKTAATTYTYDSRNFLKKVSMMDGETTANTTYYDYDSAGNKIAMRTHNGDVGTYYDYYKQGLLKTMTDPLGKKEFYSYDKSGNLNKMTDRNGTEFIYGYSNLNQLLTVSTGDKDQYLEYGYSATGAKILEKNKNLTSRFTYDGAGRLVTVVENDIKKIYTYDNMDNRKSFNLEGPGAISLTYKYDVMNRLTDVFEGENLSAKYTYDKNGNRETMTYGKGDITTEYLYNDANLVTSLTNKKGSNNLSKFTYDYYLDGNQLFKKNETSGLSTNYTYDGLGRLKTEIETGVGVTTSKTYEYDSGSNRSLMKVLQTGKPDKTTEYVYNDGNQLLMEMTYGSNKAFADISRYDYDNNGNQLSKTAYTIKQATNDKIAVGLSVLGVASNSASPQHVSLTEINEYNRFNQLVKTETGQTTVTYNYRADGLRLSKTTNGQTTTHVWDGSNIVADLNGSRQVISKYIRGVNLIKSIDKSGNSAHYVYNAHGDVVHLAKQDGSVTNYNYDAFGVEVNPNPNDANPFRYCGEYFDKETGSIYLRARYYNPTTARMLSPDTHWNVSNMIYGDNPVKWNYREEDENDPLALNSYTYKPDLAAITQSGNLYVYAMNNPLMFADPTGKAAINAVFAAIGAIGGAFFGNYMAKGLGYDADNWQYWAITAGVTVGGAVIGWFAGAVLCKLATDFLLANPAIMAKMPGFVLSFLGLQQGISIADKANFFTQSIININKLYSTGKDAYNSISSIINAASYYDNRYDQVASVVRGIASHAFLDGNKRTAVDSLFMLLKEMGLKYSITYDQAWKLVNDIATGAIKNVSEISAILQR